MPATVANPNPLDRAVQVLASAPVAAGAVVAILVAGGILAYPWFFGSAGSGSGAGGRPASERTGQFAAGPSMSAEPWTPPSTGPGEAQPVFTDAAPPIPTVTATSELGPIRQHPRVSARDNGQSVGYGNRSVWIFADTVFRNPFGFISNTAAVTSDLSAGDGLNLTSNNPFTADTAGDPVQIIALSAAERDFEYVHRRAGGCTAASDRYCDVIFGFWPGPVISDPVRGRLLIFYSKICRRGAPGTPCSGPLGRDLGSGVAVLDMRTNQVTRLTAIGRPVASSVEGPDPTIFFPPGGEFTAAALTVGDTAYVYGACTSACKLARVGLGDIADLDRWTFFTGRDATGSDRWSADPARSVNTVAAGSAGHSVLWNPALRCFLNVFLPPGTDKALFQVGGSPFGPWSATRPLMDTAPAGGRTNYALFGHAEYAEWNGLVQYISYYQPDTGHQRLVRVTFAPGD